MIAPGERLGVPQPVGNDEDPGWCQGRLIHLVDDEAQEYLIITPPSSEIAPPVSTASARGDSVTKPLYGEVRTVEKRRAEIGRLAAGCDDSGSLCGSTKARLFEGGSNARADRQRVPHAGRRAAGPRVAERQERRLCPRRVDGALLGRCDRGLATRSNERTIRPTAWPDDVRDLRRLLAGGLGG